MTDTAVLTTEKKKRIIRSGDFGMIVSTLILSLFGVIMVFSASYYTGLSKYGDAFYYLKDALKWFVLGWLVFAFFSLIDCHFWGKFYWAILGIGFVFLVALLVLPESLGLTQTINNATRWLVVPHLFSFMPGEVIKFCFVIFFASYYSKHKNVADNVLGGVFIPLLIAGAAFILIYEQPNLSTAGIVLLMAGAIMIVAGIAWKWIIGLVLIGGVGAVGLFFLKGADYMKSRLDNFWDPFADSLGKGYQVCQGLLAFGSGGVKGLGLGHSVQKALYLPEPMNDFILPIVGEELGFIGVVALIAVYAFLIYRLMYIAINASDRYGMLVAAGVAIHIALQVIINIAVVTASFPPTGVVLPLISLGGTATVLIMGELGLAYNVSRQMNKL